jgi:hypothetical protein
MKKFKYKCEALNCYVCFNIYTNECNMQHLNNGFNKFKVDDSTCATMLIVQKMWKNLLNHSNISVEHWVTCASIYSNKCNLWH